MNPIFLRATLFLAVLFAAGAARADDCEQAPAVTAGSELARPLSIAPGCDSVAPVDGDGLYLDPNMQVTRINGFGHYDSWSVVDRDTIIVWATPRRPYLVELLGGSAALRSRNAIGFTTVNGQLTRFDAVLVEGQRLPIRAIYKLTREQARALLRVA